MSVGINGGGLELSEFLREAKSVSQLLPEIAFCLLMLGRIQSCQADWGSPTMWVGTGL